MTVSPDLAVRKAALTLYAMSPEDRNWLVSQLSVDQRGLISPLLEELTTLGVLPEPLIVAEALREAARPRVQTAADDGNAFESSDSRSAPRIAPNASQVDRRSDSNVVDFARLSTTQIDALVTVLRREPNSFVAYVLRIQPWAWGNQVLDRLGVVRRREVTDILNTWARKNDSLRSPWTQRETFKELSRNISGLPSPQSASQGIPQPHLERQKGSASRFNRLVAAMANGVRPHRLWFRGR